MSTKKKTEQTIDTPQENKPAEIIPPIENPVISADIESIAENIIDTQPVPSEHAMQAKEAEKIITENKFKDLKDSTGEYFDPAKHKINKLTGQPCLSSKGKFYKINPLYKQQKESVLNAQIIDQEKQRVEMDAKIKATGTVSASIIFTLGTAFGGEEWQPKPEEKTMLENSFAEYYRATGKVDLPPGIALTVAIMAYALPRVTMPKTQDKVKTMWAKFHLWRANRKVPKAIEEKENKKEGDIK